MTMGRTVITDRNTCFHQKSDFVPTHGIGSPLIDRVGGDEKSEWETRLAQTWPGLSKNRFCCVIDCNADGFVRQRLSSAERGNDMWYR